MTPDESIPIEIDDGFGSIWTLCRPDCGMEVVRPGKVQCDMEDCPDNEVRAILDKMMEGLEEEIAKDP